MEPLSIHLLRDNNNSLAEQLMHQVLGKILNGEIAAGKRLPTERELAEKLNISRGTVKRAPLKYQYMDESLLQ